MIEHDLVGEHIGKHLVIGYAYDNKFGHHLWHTECTICGYKSVRKNSNKHYGCKMCSSLEQRESRRKYPICHNAFSVVNIETAYWLGFLMADGNVSKTKVNIKISLKKSDRSHLKEFYKFVGCENKPIYKCPKNILQSQVTSRQIAYDLIACGIIPRKSFIPTTIRSDIAEYPSFWLGLLDGDGSVGMLTNKKNCSPKPYVSWAGSKDLLMQATKIISSVVGKQNALVKQGNIYQLRYVGQNAQKVIRYLYQNKLYCLKRKRISASKALKWRPLIQHSGPTKGRGAMELQRMAGN